MPTQVDIPGTGVVEFPDSMSQDQIKATIKRKFYSGTQTASTGEVTNRLPAGMKPTAFVPQPSSDFGGELGVGRQVDRTPSKASTDTTDYAGQSLLGISPEDIPSGAGTTAPGITIPLSAAAKTVAGVAQFATSPRGLAEIGAAATPAAPAVYLKWAYDMIKGGIKSAENVGESLANLIRDHINNQMASQTGGEKKPVDEEEVQRLAEESLNTAVMLLGGASAGVHGVKGVVTPLKVVADTMRTTAPATAAALEAQAGKGTDAIQRQTETVLQPVQSKPEQGAREVSATGTSAEAGTRSEQVVPEKTQDVSDAERYKQLTAQMKEAKANKDLAKMQELQGELIDIQRRQTGTSKGMPPGQISAHQELVEKGYKVIGGGRFESETPPPPEAFNVSQFTVGGKTTYTFRLPPKVVAATYTNPETGVTTAAANHPEAREAQGVEPSTREGREQGDDGFLVQQPSGETKVVSRQEGERIAQESGQALPKQGEQIHSDEITSPTQPDKPLSEVPQQPKVVNPLTEEQVGAMPDEEVMRRISALGEFLQRKGAGGETIPAEFRVNVSRLYQEAKKRGLTKEVPFIEDYLKGGAEDPKAALKRMHDAWDSGEDQNLTERDLLDQVMGLIDDQPDSVPKALQKAAQKFQDAIEEDFHDYAGRSGEPEIYQEKFMSALGKFLEEKPKNAKPEVKKVGYLKDVPGTVPQKLTREVANAIVMGKVPEDALINPVVEVVRATVLRGSGESTTDHPYVTIRINGKQVFRGTPSDFDYQKPLENLGAELREVSKSGKRTVYSLKLKEFVEPAKDKPIGVNERGEKLYQRSDGYVYRMRMDRKDKPHGYPDFGGDLAPVEKEPAPSTGQSPGSTTPPEKVSRSPVEGGTKQAEGPVSMTPEGAVTAEPSPQVNPETTPKSTESPMGSAPSAESRTPSKGIAASVRNKWSSATDKRGEAGFIDLSIVKDLIDSATGHVKAAYKAIRDIGTSEMNIGKMDDYRKSVLGWSSKLQRSFAEAAQAQREITQKVPDPIRREGITNWIQANGDMNLLQQRANATTNPKLKKGYEAAMNLTPEEMGVARDVINAYQALGTRGQFYGVLNSFKQNYVTQIWNLNKGPMFAGSRTLRDKFRFSKASTFPTFFDGEQAGYVPKTKDISKILPVYMHEMNAVIAARQLVEDLSGGVASDGRPLTAPRGRAVPVQNASGSATLVMPKALKGADTSDYKVLPDQPAINDWTWAGKDEAGNPVFMKSDLALHPEAYQKLKNVLGKSAIREWYNTKTSSVAEVPKVLVKGLDMANSETKRTMLGLFAPFHQVQEGTHAIGHRVNPFFNIPKVDLLNNADQIDATEHGLMLQPDRASAESFMEGFRTSGLVSKLPKIGPWADAYSNYLFHEYIPGLKFKTYQAILERNRAVYEADINAGTVTDADVKHLSAEQANAAYGHLNYTDLARNPTIQHIMQLGALAPDFLEARARFAGQSIKGATGLKVGREQVTALATLAIAQATTAYIGAQLTGGEWDRKHPFEFHAGNRRYAMRSVPEDIASLIDNLRKFAYSRISPIIGKGTLQYLSGVDYRGQKVTAGDTTKELLQQPIPISVRGFLGVGKSSGLAAWEQLAGAVGLRISRYSYADDIYPLVEKWKKNNPDQKIQEQYEQHKRETAPTSVYRPMRDALSRDDMEKAKEEYTKLLQTHTERQISHAMRPKQGAFTGSGKTEAAFKESLTEEQRATYDKAIKEREDLYQKFLKLQ